MTTASRLFRRQDERRITSTRIRAGSGPLGGFELLVCTHDGTELMVRPCCPTYAEAEMLQHALVQRGELDPLIWSAAV